MDSRLTPKQQKRQQEREIIDEHHKLVTEQALEPLYQFFLQWKSGALPYFELTELIHAFHKKNQKNLQGLHIHRSSGPPYTCQN